MDRKSCERCGVVFSPKYRVTRKYWDKRRFCSDKCREASVVPPPRIGTGKPLADRFWEKVAKRAPTQCWLWCGATTKDGYGYLVGGADLPGVSLRAHRVSWEIHNAPLKPGEHVLHRCDNPPCVNPRHLFLGDQVANNADRDLKGRGGDTSGERNGRSVLTDKQVELIRERYRSGQITQRALGEEFGVSEVQIWRIVHRYQRKD